MEPTPPSPLAPLPYEDWSDTKTTLQLFTQIVGKIQLRYTRLRNHWWNVTYRTTARGIATHLMRAGDLAFDVEFDFIDHRVVLRSNRTRETSTFALHDGLSVAEFYEAIFALFASIGLVPDILAVPYGQTDTTPFARDVAHHRYDGALVRRWWEALLWTTDVLDEFAVGFVGKQSEPQLFWHSFDLAVGRFSGHRSPAPIPEDAVAREAYSAEVIAFGFWAGDANIPAPSFYTYTAPEPPTLSSFPLRPAAARWSPSGSGHLGILAYDAVREASDPRRMLLDFFASGFEAGTTLAPWDTSELARRTGPSS